jgi:hypothetical protein
VANTSSESLRLYEILLNLNQGFEQGLAQLQLLEKLGLGRQPWNALCVMGRRTAPTSTSNWSSGRRHNRVSKICALLAHFTRQKVVHFTH